MNTTQQHSTQLPKPPTVTLQQYTAAVALLLDLALKHSDTSGARAAAQVLLGTYNADCFHLDITDLCLLEGQAEAAAWAVMIGRVQLREEPHKLLTGGFLLFEQLWEKHAHLNTDQRYARNYRSEA